MAKKIFTTIFIIIFVPIAMATILLFSLRLSLLNPNFIKAGLNKANFYNQVAEEALTSLVKTQGSNNFTLGPVNQDQAIAMVQNALPASFIKTQIETTLDNFSDFIAGKNNDWQVNINLINAKQTLASEYKSYLDKNWSSIPVCTSQDISNAQTSLSCRQTGDTSESITQEVFYGVNGIYNHMPDVLTNQSLGIHDLSVFNQARNFYHYIEIGSAATLIVSLFLLLLIILLNLSPAYSLFQSLGVAIIVPAGLILLSFLVFHLIFFTLAISNLNLGLSGSATSFVIVLIKAIVGRFLIQTEIISGGLVIISIVLLILASYLFKRSSKNNSVKVAIGSQNFDSLPSARK
jgi:hypothetical protein